MTERTPTSYDELPYASHPVQHAHPDNLWCKAFLHGLQSPDVSTSRVLELGCGTGGNLISLAQILPGGTFVGLDSAGRQIALGQAVIDTLGLKNIDLRTLSLAEVDANLGEFDYILCHGVYSWVPQADQDRILAIIRQHLAPRGVAFVSYNTLPGWHLRGLIRDILSYHVRGRGEPAAKVQRARAYLDFLVSATPEQESVYARLLRQEADLLRRTPDTYVFHEHLETVNQPLYFHEFAERIAGHSLQFLCEARSHAQATNFTPELCAQLDSLARDRLEYEQQIDILCNGTFRRSLLCHSEVAVASQPSAMALRELRLATRARPVSGSPDLKSDAPEEFRGPDKESITTTHPLIKASLVCLAEQRPRSVPFNELLEKAYAKLGQSPNAVQSLQDTDLLAAALLRCHECDLIEVFGTEAAFALAPSERPVASPLARLQASQGEPVTSLRHRIVDLSQFDIFVLSQLDGSRNEADLRDAVMDQVRQGRLVLEHRGQPVHEKGLIESVVEQAVPMTLEKLRNLAVLIT
jgi:methyltransferase-like protein/SAM-dependent methyltransferase